MDDLQLKRDIARKASAERILKDPMIKDAIKTMREAVYHNIATSKYTEHDEREELYRMLKAIDAFEAQFTRIIDTGKLALSKLDQLRNKLTQILR